MHHRATARATTICLAQCAQDFTHKWEGDFAAKGSAETPSHSQGDFRFFDHAPLVFRQLRERFGISTEDYMLSLTSEYVL